MEPGNNKQHKAGLFNHRCVLKMSLKWIVNLLGSNSNKKNNNWKRYNEKLHFIITKKKKKESLYQKGQGCNV